MIKWQYAELLLETTGVDIRNQVDYVETNPSHPNLNQIPEKVVYTCCGKQEWEIGHVNKESMLACWQCGKILEEKHTYILEEDEYPDDGKPLGSKSQYGPLPKRRIYKRITHFKEHIRRYVGARFTPVPADIMAKLRTLNLNVNDKNCYQYVKEALRALKRPKLYKEIFTIIYELGGKAPKIDHLITRLYSMYKSFDYYYDYLRARLKRKNGISYYMILDLMLKDLGAPAYYTLPYLKDEELQQKVLTIFAHIKQRIENGDEPT